MAVVPECASVDVVGGAPHEMEKRGRFASGLGRDLGLGLGSSQGRWRCWEIHAAATAPRSRLFTITTIIIVLVVAVKPGGVPIVMTRTGGGENRAARGREGVDGGGRGSGEERARRVGGDAAAFRASRAPAAAEHPIQRPYHLLYLRPRPRPRTRTRSRSRRLDGKGMASPIPSGSSRQIQSKSAIPDQPLCREKTSFRSGSMGRNKTLAKPRR